MKTVLITGASSGIGRELAFVYAEKGYNLFLTARRAENLKGIKSKIESQHKVELAFFALDLSLPASAEQLFAKVKELGLEINILINNAGFGIYSSFLESDITENEKMLNLNILSLTKLTYLFAKQMVDAGGGQIVNIASNAAFQGVPYLSAYAASKAYVMHFGEALAFELKPKNVFVTTICPGATESEFGEVAGFKDGKVKPKMPSSRELAEFIHREAAKKKVNAIHGRMNAFMTFSQRFVPRKLITKITASLIKQD